MTCSSSVASSWNLNSLRNAKIPISCIIFFAHEEIYLPSAFAFCSKWTATCQLLSRLFIFRKILSDAINEKATHICLSPSIVHPHFSARLVGAYGRPDVRHRSSNQLTAKEPCVWLTFQMWYLSSSDRLKNFSSLPFLVRIRDETTIRFGYGWWKDFIPRLLLIDVTHVTLPMNFRINHTRIANPSNIDISDNNTMSRDIENK